jgi:hypothetical protein
MEKGEGRRKREGRGRGRGKGRGREESPYLLPKACWIRECRK